MITVSLCMIVKNEEKVISRCLDSVTGLADEIIIMDTGSTDATKAAAAEYTDKIFDFRWIDDFSAARNAAFSKATKDYILWLDADDVLEEAEREKFMELKESLDTAVDSVTMKYHLAFDENGNVSFSVRRNRLVKRACKFRWVGAVHEYLEVWGNIFHSEVAVAHKSVHHDSDRNLNIYEKRLERGEDFSPRDLYYFANELLDHRMYERAASFYEKFLEGGKGWIEDNISGCGKLADCYHQLGDNERELGAVLRSFRYARPRPEFCCRLGYYFLQRNDISSAIFWYKLAAEWEPDKNNMGFFNPTFSTWLPHLQLCVCYERLGMHEQASLHNETARGYRPTDPRILQNRRYFEALMGEKNAGADKECGKNDGVPR